MPKTYLTDLYNQLIVVFHKHMDFFIKRCHAEIITTDNQDVKWKNQICAIWTCL